MQKQTPLEVLGARIRDVRVKAGKSQREIAQLLDVAKQTVSQWELGKSPPMITNLIKFSAVMGIDIRDLLSELSEDLSPTDPVFRRLSAASTLIPIVGSEIESGALLMTGLAASKSSDFISTVLPHEQGDIAMKVASRANEGKFFIGDIVKLRAHPKEVEPGQYVLAHAQGQTVFRKYMPAKHGTCEGARLVPFNTSYPTIVMTSDDLILGVMSEYTGFSHD